MKDVKVKLDFNSEDVDVALTIDASEIKEGGTSNVFVGVVRNPEVKMAAFTSQCFLLFTVCELGNDGKVTSSY